MKKERNMAVRPPLLPPVIAVCGVKNSGKTTLLTRLLPLLRAEGLNVAAIKHDGHDFCPDVPGTDSARLAQAGADVVAVFSAHRYLINVARPDFSLELLAPHLTGVDLVLYEGGKFSPWPKIEIVRQAVSSAPVADENILALCTDIAEPEMLFSKAYPTLALDDYPGLAQIILSHLAHARK